MNTIVLPEGCHPNQISDGYHTFGELYRHRAALLLALAASHPGAFWMSKFHDDGTMFDDFFIVGAHTPDGHITYHLRVGEWWQHFEGVGATVLDRAPKWDGHDSFAVERRLMNFAFYLAAAPRTARSP